MCIILLNVNDSEMHLCITVVKLGPRVLPWIAIENVRRFMIIRIVFEGSSEMLWRVRLFKHSKYNDQSSRLFNTHGCVSVAKKAMWCRSVLFTGTANSPFSTPCISITTLPISIKFTYFMPCTYATLHTKFERKQPSSSRDICSWILPHFLHLFLLLLRTVLQK